ncbi:MAG: energy transducer TonB [Bacteroidota bacterium]
MNTQRTSQQKLDGRKGIFLKTGIIIAMIGVLLAFQYRVPDRISHDFTGTQMEVPELTMVPITIPKPPDPPKPSVRKDLVTTKEEIVEEFVPLDVEGLPETRIPDYTPVFPEPEKEVDEDIIIDRPEYMPEFPGGDQALYKYLAQAINYPSMAVNLNIEGVVFVGFVIERDGSVSNVHVIRGIGAGCDEEAIRAVESMPGWNPGRMGTQPVRVRYTLPVRFKLKR